ncbi:MAG: carboxypeptidase-like regulatory domain-containing protein, partial [Candidatus Kapabacteria bacterium]|nr:carboxypeptidase-like regulatory domain-containing protein [Candidatus Kapabacteria bacterium]
MKFGKSKMRLVSVYVILFILGSLVVTAQDVATGTLSGTVRNSATQSAVAGVTVTIVGTKLGAITTSAGKFTIKKIPAGIVSVRVSAVGYTARVLSDVVIS